MNQLLYYLNNDLINYNLNELELYLQNSKSLDDIDNYIRKNTNNINEEALNKLVHFIKQLPSLNKYPNWQIIVRSFASRLLYKLSFMLFDAKDYEEYLKKICKTIEDICLEITLSPIPENITEEERIRLLETLKELATYYIMLNDPEWEAIKELLQKLGCNIELDKEIMNYKRIQLNNLETYGNKKRT